MAACTVCTARHKFLQMNIVIDFKLLCNTDVYTS